MKKQTTSRELGHVLENQSIRIQAIADRLCNPEEHADTDLKKTQMDLSLALEKFSKDLKCLIDMIPKERQ